MILLAMALASDVAVSCNHDHTKLLSLSEEQFDQDLNGGWRLLDDAGCTEQAADLLRYYRLARRRQRPDLLAWHEGQLRAELGQTARAIALFERSHRTTRRKNAAWNLYVDGSIAFLNHDYPTLYQARVMLAALPRPRHLPTARIGTQKIHITWPPNLNVLDGLLQCFDKPYRDAYACVTVTHISA